ncbi:hypothetical protein, partial [Microbacterium sp.]|uniref:hypothetical protein n=1 Tax=Microbacterium sp. TaxID=51671 RepID=UPI003C70F006
MDLNTLAGSIVAQSFPDSTRRAALRLVQTGRVSLFDADAAADVDATPGRAGGRAPGAIAQIDAIVTDGVPEMVSLRMNTQRATVEVSCGCGEAPACVHVAAALVELSGERPPAPVPPWRRELDRILPAGADDAADQTRLCILVQIDRSPRGYGSGRTNAPRVAIRPGMLGTRGTWIKGTAGWDRYDGLDAPADQLALLGELDRLTADSADGYYSYYDRIEWRPLHQTPSRTLWPMLTTLADAGIPLVSAAKSHLPVRLDGAPATARIAVTEARGRLRVAGEVTVDGAVWTAPLLFVGDPAIALAEVTDAGTASESIILHPFAQPVTAPLRRILERSSHISVDKGGRDEFERSYLPRLRTLAPIQSPDDSYTPPAPPEVVLNLSVQHEDRQTHLTWEWDRGFVGAPPDAERESAIVAAVAEAAGAHAALILRTGDDAGGVPRGGQSSAPTAGAPTGSA